MVGGGEQPATGFEKKVTQGEALAQAYRGPSASEPATAAPRLRPTPKWQGVRARGMRVCARVVYEGERVGDGVLREGAEVYLALGRGGGEDGAGVDFGVDAEHGQIVAPEPQRGREG